jgi:hypothetical protein
MLTWLRNRPAKVRQAARPAVREQRTEDGGRKTEDGGRRTEDGRQRTEVRDQKSVVIDHESDVGNQELQAATVIENSVDTLPPAFFADDDPAFLDLTEPNQHEVTPPPLPQISFSLSTQRSVLSTADTALVSALKSLPPWPKLDDPNRTEQLLEILRRLDRIAGDVCTALESEREGQNPLLLPRKSR